MSTNNTNRFILESQENQINEQFLEIHQEWKKVENDSRKTGLRDGLSDGRKENFQTCFDKGFEEGFKNALLLGNYKGSLIASSIQNKLDCPKLPILQKTSRGDCEICKDSGLMENDVEAIIKKQTDRWTTNLEYLEKNAKK